MTSEKVYDYTTEGAVSGTPKSQRTFTYASGWKDQLVSVNGTALTYDGVGNLVSFNGRTFTWKNGRQLASTTGNGTTVSFTYDHNGMRVSKTVGSDKHTYVYAGTLLLQEKATGLDLKFSYDSLGNPIAVLYNNGEEYYYVKNLQGDIVGLVDKTGNWVVEYRYDAWGNILSTTGSLASSLGAVNPFRYRGYFYDAETGFYYVSSRYYDPEVGRFISADSEISGVGGDIRGYNLYAYCMNNPVNMSDPDGNWPKWVQKIGNTVKKTVSNVVNKVKSVVTKVKKKLTKKHYEERANKNGIHPTYNQVVSSSSWTKVSKDQTQYHDDGVGKAELKFTNSDGREAVFNGDTLQPMTDPRYIATYNFCPIQQLPDSPGLKDYVTYGVTMVGHTWQDVIPYYIWGNSPDDTTTFMDRILMSF